MIDALARSPRLKRENADTPTQVPPEPTPSLANLPNASLEPIRVSTSSGRILVSPVGIMIDSDSMAGALSAA